MLNGQHDEFYTSKRIALLTNLVTPYHAPVYKILRSKIASLKIFVAVEMEPNRSWEPNWEGLDVVLQRNMMVSRNWKHPQGFSETAYIHIPYDSI